MPTSGLVLLPGGVLVNAHFWFGGPTRWRFSLAHFWLVLVPGSFISGLVVLSVGVLAYLMWVY